MAEKHLKVGKTLQINTFLAMIIQKFIKFDIKFYEIKTTFKRFNENDQVFYLIIFIGESYDCLILLLRKQI